MSVRPTPAPTLRTDDVRLDLPTVDDPTATEPRMHAPDDPEAPEADVAEQHTPVLPNDTGDDDPVPDIEVPFEADPADVVEQAIEVTDDDEQR
jgi:hypothetical protein